jgi:hypothetical protein
MGQASCEPMAVVPRTDTFSRRYDCLAAKLRPGNVPTADDREELLLPVIERHCYCQEWPLPWALEAPNAEGPSGNCSGKRLGISCQLTGRLKRD